MKHDQWIHAVSICLSILGPSIATGNGVTDTPPPSQKKISVAQTEEGIGIKYCVPLYAPLLPGEWPAVTMMFAPNKLPNLTKEVMVAKEVRWPGRVRYDTVRADRMQLPLFTHVALDTPEKLTCYRIVLADTYVNTVKPDFVLGISFRELLKKYDDEKRTKPSFDPVFLNNSCHISAAVCAFKTIDGHYVFQRFLSDIETMHMNDVKSVLASELERLSRDSTLPSEVHDRPAVVAAFRDAKTYSVRVAWFTINDEDPHVSSKWPLLKFFRDILDATGMRIVDQAADVEFAIHLKVVESERATYTAKPASGRTPHPVTTATKTCTEGSVLLKKDGVVIHTISLQGRHQMPSSFELPGGCPDPTIGALGSSGFHKELLSLLVEARGPGLLKPIIDKYRMVISVTTDSGGGWATYQSLFDVVAESPAPWAETMLQELARDVESESAQRMAKQALEKRKRKSLTNVLPPRQGIEEPSVYQTKTPSPSKALLPPFQDQLQGSNPVRVRNPNVFEVATGIRTGRKGKDFDVPANGVQTVYVPNGKYEVFFIYSDKPDALFQGDSFTLDGNGIEIQIVKVVNGNYGIRQVK